jgi:Arc/MetJ-type ribon-helix-helix transcriptional regulator
MIEKKTVARKYTTITIPAQLFGKIKKSIENTGFSSVSDYVTFVLRETVAEAGRKDGKKGAVLEKLAALGYTG